MIYAIISLTLLMPIITVPRFHIYKAVTDVSLIVFYISMWDMEDYFIWGSAGGQISTHLARVTAHSWGGELDPCWYVPAFWIVSGGQRETAADGGHFVTESGGQQL